MKLIDMGDKKIDIEKFKDIKIPDKYNDGMEYEHIGTITIPTSFRPKEVQYCSKSCRHFVDLSDGKWAGGGLCRIWNKVLEESKVQGIYLCCDECIKDKERTAINKGGQNATSRS